MTAPAGAIVGLYVDLASQLELDDVIETGTGRRYRVVSVRVQERGRHRGRQHVRALVLAVDDQNPPDARVHRIRWYKRASRKAKPR